MEADTVNDHTNLLNPHRSPRFAVPLWLGVALLIAGLAIGAGLGIAWEGRAIVDAVDSAENAEAAALAAEAAAVVSRAAIEGQTEVNGRRLCEIAVALRALTLAHPLPADVLADLPPVNGECLP